LDCLQYTALYIAYISKLINYQINYDIMAIRICNNHVIWLSSHALIADTKSSFIGTLLELSSRLHN
jgi:hypothetical protein